MNKEWKKVCKFKPGKVLIAGGTGFIGYHTALKLLDMNIKVSSIALENEIALGSWFPKEIELHKINLFEQTEDQIYNMFKACKFDTFIYALGPDDRVTPKAPAAEFFQKYLVENSLKVCKALKRTGVKRCIVLSSYFAYFDKLQNGELSKYHPYINARIMQQQQILSIAEEGKFDVMFMELPYIFGTMPEREPIWKSVFLDRFEKYPNIYFPNGGTAAVAVDGVANSIVAAMLNGTNGECYPVCSENITYKTMLNTMMIELGSKKRFRAVPVFICKIFGKALMNKEKKHGKESGLHLVKLMSQIQSKKMYIDPAIVQQKLDYQSLGLDGGTDVIESIKQTMLAIKK